MSAESLGLGRVFSELEKEGDLIVIDREVDPENELAGIIVALDKAEGAPPILFQKVRGYDFRVGANLFIDRRRVCRILQLPQDPIAFKENYLRAIENPIPPVMVEKAPCQEVVLEKDFNLFELVPSIKAGLDDGGRYLQPVIITKDPERGIRNAGMYRGMMGGGNRLIVNIRKEAHIGLHFERAKRAGDPFPLAIVIGAHPDVYYAACTKLPHFQDELALAGALRGRPAELVRCRTVDLEVPACADIVIEGEVRPPYAEAVEGPWPEYLKYLSLPAKRPIMDVTAITFRKNKFSYAVVAGTKENYALRVSNAPMLYGYIKKIFPDFVVDAAFTPGSAYWHHAVIQVNKSHYELEGMQINVALTAFGFSTHVDTVILVDPDIDLGDLNDVDWAIATRCNPKEQVHILPEGRGYRIPPIVGVKDMLENPRLTKAKMIIDATIPFHLKEKERGGIKMFERARIRQVDLRDYLCPEDVKKYIR
ncbi:MAG: UbiD family decarboxylase [Deltaproteobacteria bacterium]|nr:UbiD family decarboxylase [Deltaproteobacteria bacterium]